MAVTRGNWQTPLEVAQPPDDDLSQLPSQLPHQVWEDVSSGWRPGSLQREDPQLNFVSDGGDHVHHVSWQQSHHHSHHRQNSVSESRRTALEDNRTTAGMLRPVSEIPERYRSLFSQFPYFNIVQSTVFQDVFHSDRSVVVSAPTGSGKTVVMELALVRLLHTLEHQLQQQPSGYIQPRSRVVYLAPMKAVVTERHLDWRSRLSALGLTCAEVTGDTEHDDISVIRNSQVVLTTPEKWDSLTRRWRDHASVMQAVSLLLIDEVHLLNDENRGPTLEAVVSRMKTIRSTRPNTDNSNVALRFIAVSATIPNIEDVAAWLSDEHGPAVAHKLEEALRPVKLRQVVLGYESRESWSEFRFDLSLNYRLPSVISTYSDNKPTLVFVSTRKAAQSTATTLTKEARLVRDSAHKQILSAVANSLRDNKLRECVLCGVGYHHAGLETTDRHQLEELFMDGQLPVLVATSTLAMGVNLPAHLVVIKSTEQYVGGAYQEYSAAQLLQMMGRAGRPQFDTHATAVIMTKNQHKVKYENLVTGRCILESHLHLHLIEHLNAEIVLGTVTDLGVAVEWLRSTFLYVRVQHNPRHYKIPQNLQQAQLEDKLQEMCMREVNALARAGLIVMNEVDVKPTPPGRLMARYCVSFNTMETFIQMHGEESLKELLETVCGCREFWDIKVRTSEKRLLNELNKSQTTSIRFPIKGRIKTREQKINCLVQATLGCQTILDPGLSQDANKIMRTGQRITKCLAEYGATRREYEMQLNTTLLCKCFSSRLWENSRYVTRQLDKIGPVLSDALVRSKITSFTALEAESPRNIELILNRQPPFGNRIRDQAVRLPRYELIVQHINEVRVEHSEVRVTVCLANQEEVRAGATTPKHHSCRLILGDADNNVLYNQRITDAALVISGSVSRVVKVTRAQTGDELPVNFISETWAGLDVQSSYSPRYLPRPQTFSADPHITMPAPLAPHKQRGREGGGKNNTVAVNEGGWRACLHTCGDKRTCAHKCCKVGVSSRPECSSSSSSTVGVPEMLQEIRKRSNQLLQTSVKKIKMNESGGTTSLSKFKYSPCGPRLMHVPTPIRSSTLQVHANDNLRQPKVVQKILKYNATETYNQANTSENKSCGNANNRVFHDSTNSHGRIPRPTYADNQCQIEKLIDEDVLNEFENGWNFDEEYQDDFPEMDIFTSEKENYTGENKVSTETYEGTFSKPLGAEYPEVSENLSTSWNRFKFRQKHTKSQNQEPNNQLHPPYTKLPPKIQLNKPSSQRSTDQRPEIKQMQQIQQVSAVPESEQRTQNISRMQSREVQRLLCQAKGRNHKAAQRHSQSSVNNNNRLLSPILKEDSQNKLTVSSLGTHITHDTQSLRPLGIQTFRYHRPSSPSAVKAIQPQRFIRPTETESNYDERCVRTFGEQSKQPQSSTHLSRAQANTHQESLALQTKQISRPTVSQENQAGHIQTPIRPLGQQANQGQRPVQLPFEPTNDFAGTMPPFPQTRQIKTPLRMPSPYTYQKPQQTSVVQSIRNQRLPQPLDSRGFTSQNHYPRLANNQNQTASYIFSNESSKPEQASFQEKHQEPIPFRSYGSIPQEYQTLNYPQVTSSCLPHTSLPNFQHHEDEQVVTPGEHSDSGRSALVQQLHQSNVNLVSRRHQSLEDQVMPVQLHSLNYPSQTLDEDYYSQGSDYKDWSALQDYELPFDISKQEMCESSSNPSNSSHLKPVAGIKPSVSYSGQCTGSTQDKNDPFSHLTKEWTESQCGRPRSKLNIFTPTVPTKELRCGAKGSVSSKEPRQHNDDWRDLEMFQWCRQQEMLALQSLYHRVQEPVARKPNEPQQAGGESDPSCGNQPPASDTRNTHKISPGKLHITYGAWDKNPAVNVGLTGIGGVQQNININLSGILGDAGVTQAAPLPLSSPATFSQSRGEPQVRGILKKPSKDVWSAAPDIFEGIL